MLPSGHRRGTDAGDGDASRAPLTDPAAGPLWQATYEVSWPCAEGDSVTAGVHRGHVETSSPDVAAAATQALVWARDHDATYAARDDAQVRLVSLDQIDVTP